jgi:Holliday junction resolvasome RuvABC endonuclease subunit
MSLQSPGIVVRQGEDLHFACFQQRKRETLRQRDAVGPHVYLTVWPMAVGDYWDRVHSVVTRVTEFLENFGDDLHIYIENYAFGSRSSSVSKLCELGGALRYQLYIRKWSVTEVSPMTVKKIFSGSGKSTKSQMIQTYLSRGYPHLYTSLNCGISQHPFEDLVDAVAVLCTGVQHSKRDRSKDTECNNPRATKKRKVNPK